MGRRTHPIRPKSAKSQIRNVYITVASACKTFHSFKLDVSHNCQDVFRKYFKLLRTSNFSVEYCRCSVTETGNPFLPRNMQLLRGNTHLFCGNTHFFRGNAYRLCEKRYGGPNAAPLLRRNLQLLRRNTCLRRGIFVCLYDGGWGGGGKRNSSPNSTLWSQRHIIKFYNILIYVLILWRALCGWEKILEAPQQ